MKKHLLTSGFLFFIFCSCTISPVFVFTLESGVLASQSSSIFPRAFTWGGDFFDEGSSIAIDQERNIYTVGTGSLLDGGLNDQILLKWNSQGYLLWNQTWKGIGYDYGKDLAIGTSGSIYTVGYTNSTGSGNSDFLLVKWDSEGFQLWNRTWGGTRWDSAWGIALGENESVYTIGETWSNTDPDIVLIKWNSEGNILWERKWGGTSWDRGYDVTLDEDGNIYTVGIKRAFGEGTQDILLIKWDSEGNQLWDRTWGGEADDIGMGVKIDLEGYIYTVGSTASYVQRGTDVILIKWDADGNILWNETWGGIDTELGNDLVIGNNEYLYTVGQMKHTGLFGVGNYILSLVKWDSQGNKIGIQTWSGSNNDEGQGLAMDQYNNIYCVGHTVMEESNSYDLVLVVFSDSNFTTAGLEPAPGLGIVLEPIAAISLAILINGVLYFPVIVLVVVILAFYINKRNHGKLK
ncbi:MAG: hypothetical protein ACFFDI_21150 [Promethearchaeota archaeon]